MLRLVLTRGHIKVKQYPHPHLLGPYSPHTIIIVSYYLAFPGLGVIPEHLWDSRGIRCREAKNPWHERLAR